MSRVQKIFRIILPKKLFKEIEEESGNWFFECIECGHSISYLEAGGLRAYATKKKKVFGYCRVCKKFKFFDVVKRV
jgi:hypothetical protein